MELKDKTKKIREFMGLSQKEFGTMFLNSNQTELSFIERGFIPEDKRKVKVVNNMYKILNERGLV